MLTQYNSKSLNSYLQKAYDLGVGVHLGGEGYVEVVAAAQVRASQVCECSWAVRSVRGAHGRRVHRH